MDMAMNLLSNNAWENRMGKNTADRHTTHALLHEILLR